MNAPPDVGDFKFDYIFVKFHKYPKPMIIPWIEVADGDIVADKLTDDEIVIAIKSKPETENGLPVVSAETVNTPEAVEKTLKKDVLIKYLESKLKEGQTDKVLDYGTIEDIRIQPAKRDMTGSVYSFLEKHGAA